MQRGLDATPLDLISISEAAKKIGVNKSTLSRQVDSGAIRSHGGKVVLSEVLEDRVKNINLSQSRRRPKGRAAAKGTSAGATKPGPDATAPGADATGGDDDDLVLLDGKLVSFAQAQRIKENYLARQRALDYEKDAGRLVDRAAAEKAFFDQARTLRDAWLGWPARIATLMGADLGVEDRTVVEVLSKYVRQHLNELGEPAAPELAPPD
jgi:hypothetical protein